MTTALHHYIDGKRLSGKGRSGDVYNPATSEKAAQVPFASKAEVDTAIAGAEAALPAWSAMPPLQIRRRFPGAASRRTRGTPPVWLR
jgi:malonate-semialdehyde dehydrogenase (acetylating)/methylmalonate-semialdehyde dehydrogenase